MLSFSATITSGQMPSADAGRGGLSAYSSPPDTRQELGRNTHSGQEGWEEASEVEWGAESVKGTGLCDHPVTTATHLQTGCKEHEAPRTSSHRHAGQE